MLCDLASVGAYWGLRDYGVAGQIGLEATPDAYVAKMVDVFREVRRVLKNDGTLWLNLGDSYARMQENNVPQSKNRDCAPLAGTGRIKNAGLKPKDLVGIPWLVAFALQADGWYLRSDIIWAKPNPMPESVTDRPTKAHEYIFLMSKSERYWYDAEAIAESMAESSIERLSSQPTLDQQVGSTRVPGKTNGNMKAVGHLSSHMEGTPRKDGDRWRTVDSGVAPRGSRNKRSVWTITTQPYKDAHFATFPPKLIEPCILAGCPPGGTVLDPFMGSGTTLYVAKELNRDGIGIELNAEYIKLAEQRLAQEVINFD